MVKFRHFLAFLTYFSSLCRKNDHLSVFTAYFYNLNIFKKFMYTMTSHPAHTPMQHMHQNFILPKSTRVGTQMKALTVHNVYLTPLRHNDVIK